MSAATRFRMKSLSCENSPVATPATGDRAAAEAGDCQKGTRRRPDRGLTSSDFRLAALSAFEMPHDDAVPIKDRIAVWRRPPSEWRPADVDTPSGKIPER
jgi:hypothetical protein